MRIASAIESKQLLRFTYDGYVRTVEPHAYGVDTKGHQALRAYQVAGGSSSDEFRGWKLFHVHEIQCLTVMQETFSSARQGYKRGDKGLTTIYAQL